MKDLALPRQQVVLDAKALHGLEMRPHDGVRHQVRQFGQFSFTRLDRVQRLLPPLERLGIALIVSRSAGIKVPAQVVEPLARIADQAAHFHRRFSFEKVEPHHHVCYLNAGVVDVVLHFDRAARGPQHAHECVAEDGVADVADVRGLVRIDVGVLDDDLPGRRRLARRASAAEQRLAVPAAVKAKIEVAVACDFELRHPLDRGHFRKDLGGDRPRRFPQFARQLESHSQPQFAEARLLGRLQNGFCFNPVADSQMTGDTPRNTLFKLMKHKNPSIAANRLPNRAREGAIVWPP